MKNDFSIILNSRGRVPLLKNLISNIEKTTKFLDKTEVLIRIDDDDKESVEFAAENTKSYVKFFIDKRAASLNACLTFLAQQSSAEFVFQINDDCEILTQNWDEIILNKIQEYRSSKKIKDRILYVGVEDNSMDKTPGAKYSSFCAISKKAIDVIGLIMYEEFVGLGGDSSIYRVYEAIDRVLNVPEVKMDHFYHSSYFAVVNPDLTAHEMRVNSHNKNINPFTFDISKEVGLLSEHIKKKNG